MSLEKVIFHIDVNSAFLSWEAVYRLHHLGWKGDLREQVSAVGGDMAMRHGIILAKSIPAKKYRIRLSERVSSAWIFLNKRDFLPEFCVVRLRYKRCSSIVCYDARTVSKQEPSISIRLSESAVTEDKMV